jgi:hypothetical protein
MTHSRFTLDDRLKSIGQNIFFHQTFLFELVKPFECLRKTLNCGKVRLFECSALYTEVTFASSAVLELLANKGGSILLFCMEESAVLGLNANDRNATIAKEESYKPFCFFKLNVDVGTANISQSV